jgi:hypothetical protein
MEGQSMIELLTVDAHQARNVVASGRRYIDVRFIFFLFLFLLVRLFFDFSPTSACIDWDREDFFLISIF